jgi:hypothetical protein
LNNIHVGDEILLRHELKNSENPFALAAYHGAKKIGYIQQSLHSPLSVNDSRLEVRAVLRHSEGVIGLVLSPAQRMESAAARTPASVASFVALCIACAAAIAIILMLVE